jgi:acyl-homoserine-lactone acylase
MVRVLTGSKSMTPQQLMADAFDPYQPAFARLIPILVKNYDALPSSSPLKAKLVGPIGVLRTWDYKWGTDSVANSLGVFWGDALYHIVGPAMHAEGLAKGHLNVGEHYVDFDYEADKASAQDRLQALSDAVDKLTADFGKWNTPWGEINRYQRLDDSIMPHFDDSKPSKPVPFDSAEWGSIASYSKGGSVFPFGTIPNTTKKFYGTGGNSILGAVEFGPKVKAWMATVGGESGDPKSPHFTDQANAYITGKMQPVYFYPDEYKAHAEKTYHPGDNT